MSHSVILNMNDPNNSGSPKGYKQLSNDSASIQNDFMYNSNVAQASTSIRLAFLRKVYGILGVQLLITTVIGSLIMASSGIQGFLNDNQWIFLANFIVTLGVLFGLMAYRNIFPANYYLLGAFTFFESVSVGFIASKYETWTVIQAFFLTATIVLGLSLYTFQSKRDFSSLGAILFTCLNLLIFGAILHIFFQNEIIHTTLSIFGAFLFCLFIVFDTQMIMKHLSPEEYMVGVINLYLDIINLFLEILRLLNSNRD